MEKSMHYTEEEIKKLEANQYTQHAGEHTIKFTKEFFEEFKARFLKGDDSRKILEELGYDPKLIGDKRLEYIRSVTCNSIAGKDRKMKRPDADTDYSKLSNDEAIRLMETELTYLRQEVEYLKKISSVSMASNKESK